MHSAEKQWIKARKLVATQRPQAAVPILRLLAKRHPQHPGIRLDYAQVLTILGELDESRRILSKLKSSNPKDLALQIEVASGYFKMGDYRAARDQLRELWDASHDIQTGVALLEVLERLGETETASLLAEKLANKHSRAKLMQGVLYLKKGDAEKSLAILDQLLAHQSTAAEPRTLYRAQLTRANALEQLGRISEAWDAMIKAKARARPSATVLRQNAHLLDQSLSENRKRIASCGSLAAPEPCPESPQLVTGHPRSGSSVYSLHLANALNCGLADEIGAFGRALDKCNLSHKDPQKWPSDKTKAAQNRYHQQIKAFQPELKNSLRWIDKNPGLEWKIDQWLTLFPNSKVKLIRRNALDCLVSCLFTYLPINPWTLQFFDPTDTAQSIADSLEIQNMMLEKAPLHIEIIHYEDFIVSNENLNPEIYSGININHSPNYSSVTQAVSNSRINRGEPYREFLPPEALAKIEHLHFFGF